MKALRRFSNKQALEEAANTLKDFNLNEPRHWVAALDNRKAFLNNKIHKPLVITEEISRGSNYHEHYITIQNPNDFGVTITNISYSINQYTSDFEEQNPSSFPLSFTIEHPSSVTECESITISYRFLGTTVIQQYELQRPIIELTFTSATDEKSYDSAYFTNDEVTIEGDLEEGDGFLFEFTGGGVLVGTYQNAFVYEARPGTSVEKYDITQVFGTLTITDEDVPDDLVIAVSCEDNEYEFGDVIHFLVQVTNIYNSAKSVSLQANDGMTLQQEYISNLGPGEMYTTYATYTVTQTDILAGHYTASVTATINGKSWTESATATMTEPIGNLTVEVTAVSSPSNNESYDLNEEIDYEVTVTNDGNILINNIYLYSVLTNDNIYVGSLWPGETSDTYSAYYIVKERDIINGEVLCVFDVNKSRLESDGDIIIDVTPGEWPEPTVEPIAHLSVICTTSSTPANDYAYDLGEEIQYLIEVINDGNLTISNVVVEDELTGDYWNLSQPLAPEDSHEFEAQHTVLESDILQGEVFNIATASGESPDPENIDVEVENGEDPEPTVEPNGHLTVHKTTISTPSNGDAYELDETIYYNVWVENDGNLTISNIVVTDELTEDEWTQQSLVPGEMWPMSNHVLAPFEPYHVVDADDIAAGEVINIATATGDSPDPDNPDVDVTDGECPEPTVDPYAHVSFNIVTTSTPQNNIAYGLGESIEYRVRIINDGFMTITNGVLTIDATGDEWSVGRTKTGQNGLFFEPGDYFDFAPSWGAVTEQDILAGNVLIQAVFEGDSEDESAYTATATSSSVPIEAPNGHLTVHKTTSSTPSNNEAYELDETIYYDIWIENDGNLTITNINVIDELTNNNWLCSSLAPGNLWPISNHVLSPLSAYHVVDADDIAAGEVINVATATGHCADPNNPNVDVTDGECPEPTA